MKKYIILLILNAITVAVGGNCPVFTKEDFYMLSQKKCIMRKNIKFKGSFLIDYPVYLNFDDISIILENENYTYFKRTTCTYKVERKSDQKRISKIFLYTDMQF